MPPDRDRLQVFADKSLIDQPVEVAWKQDRRTYVLTDLLSSQGKTSITWKAKDGFQRDFAIKFVLCDEYVSHSLEAEMLRANSLNSHMFADIDFFGTPALPSHSIDCGDFYAIVVEWISGRTLKQFVSDPSTEVGPETFRRLSRDLCEALQLLKDAELVHNDLHDENLLVRRVRDNLTQDETVQLVVIDTGHLKTAGRWGELIDVWRQTIQTLEEVNHGDPGSVDAPLRRYRGLVEYFSRSDQEWIVFHLSQLYNCMRQLLPMLPSVSRRFIANIPESLRSMIDTDPSRRMDDPREMHTEIERTWSEAAPKSDGISDMTTPFDLPSAELIRSDRQLMELFSDEYPGLELCRSEAPVYLYGPRGCGKSTILRSLSLKAALASTHPADAVSKLPFTGIYISSSQELRSRFWLMRPEDIELLDGHVVRYFTLLLVETLVDTLDRMLQWDVAGNDSLSFGMSESIAANCVRAIRTRLELTSDEVRYARTSCLAELRRQIRRSRDELWLRILNRSESAFRPDAQLIFDLCHEVEELCPSFQERRICFLIDDYSNQRIPEALQKKLNQAITFSKQGSPIFKVTSEYDGVDLEGVQEGREVNEVNVGFEYVSFQNSPDRFRFLSNVLQRRFGYMGVTSDILEFLPPSKLRPTIPLARTIREAHTGNRSFHYHGIDTISDLCSGDFAMGIDLVRRIFEHGSANWKGSPVAILPKIQDAAIREYTKQEFEYIRYHSRDGRRKFDIADNLCWLSRQCVLFKDIDKTERKKGGERIVPVVKNHLDISEVALRELEHRSPPDAQLIRDLVSKGILFPIQDSRSREGQHATKRLMIRRILLARHATALGRDVPIRIDDIERLIFFLSEPSEFVRDELNRTSSKRESAEAIDPQQKFAFGNEKEGEGG